MAHRESCAGANVCRIVVGGLLGAGIALLFAPQTGKKTRKYLACYAKGLSDKADEAVSDFAETLSEFVENAGNRAAQMFEQGADLTLEGKKALLAALEKGQEKLEEQRKKLAEMLG